MIVVRTVTGGRIRWASVAVCVRDDGDVIAFLQPNVAANKVTAAAAAAWPDRRAREAALRQELVRGKFELVDKVPAKTSPTLTVARRGDWFSVRFVRDNGWQPDYVNVCCPYRRSAIGFDTDDLCLDLVIDRGPSGAVTWVSKDDADLDERAALGIYTDDDVEVIRAAGATAADRLMAGAAPFNGWTAWLPDPAWPQPEALPATWDDDVVELAWEASCDRH